MTALDVGCGSGNITCWMAEKVGRNGKVIALDSNQEQLEVAKQKTLRKNLVNIEFILANVNELDQLKLQVDLTFSRYLLIHLAEADLALVQMKNTLKPGGILCCDEMTVEGCFAYPESDVFKKSLELNAALFKQRNLDLNFGAKLFTHFQKMELNNICLQVVQPALINEYQKKLWPMYFSSLKQKFCNAHLINENELNELIHELIRLTQDKKTYILAMRNFQVFARR